MRAFVRKMKRRRANGGRGGSDRFLMLMFMIVVVSSFNSQFIFGQDIIFDDDPPLPQPSTSANSQGNGNREVANGRRPPFGFTFNPSRPGNPFQSFSLDLVRNPIETFTSGFQSIVNTIVNPSSLLSPTSTHSSLAPPPRRDEQLEEPIPDCRTFRNTDGYCMPLTSCSSLRLLLVNRPQVSINRILRRSICGFSGFNSLMCCPEPTGNILIDQSPPPPPTKSTTVPPPAPIVPIKLYSTTRPISLRPSPLPLRPFFPTAEPLSLPIRSEGSDAVGAECGFSNASHTRIVGGSEAQKGAWPWIATLGYREAGGRINYLCGGSLISKWHILTAAHCAGRDDLKTVRLGDHDLFSDGDGVIPHNIPVEQILISPHYNTQTFQNDIAILRLKRPVEFTHQVHPICLPSSPELRQNRFENKTPFVAGWGAIEFNGPTSAVLRETQLPVVSDALCHEKYERFKNTKVDHTNICAGLLRGGRDTCQGDSGGPLMQPLSSTQYVQIGVVSFGFKCAEPGYPGVYTSFPN